jgi:predicted  nucleic acid-binding Zn-ribbon protein
MSNKITDARIEELQRLKILKEELRSKIQAEQDAMEEILDSMNDEAQEFASSSSRAARYARGKEPSSVSHQDVLEAHKMAIARLEEDFSAVEKDLGELQEAINSTESRERMDSALNEKLRCSSGDYSTSQNDL